MDPLARPRRVLRWSALGAVGGAWLALWQPGAGLEAVGGAAAFLGALAGTVARLRG